RQTLVCLTPKPVFLSALGPLPIYHPILIAGFGASQLHHSWDLEGIKPLLMSQQSLKCCSTPQISLHLPGALGGKQGRICAPFMDKETEAQGLT
uniref:Uncharacterized protein n=1 Tax=Prolemur simus TaxID=1328070 RepID=A0A8C8Z7U1_PROSS